MDKVKIALDLMILHGENKKREIETYLNKVEGSKEIYDELLTIVNTPQGEVEQVCSS